MIPSPGRLLRTAALAALACGSAPAEVPFEAFREDCRILKHAIDALDPGQPVSLNLVLGATTQEAGRFPAEWSGGRPLTRWIFLSREPHAPSAELHVRCDFNDAQQVFMLSRILEGRVSAILPDWSVMKFTRWNAAHLGSLKRMLRPGGTLFLPVETWGHVQLGINEDGTPDPEDFPPVTGEAAADAPRFARSIHRAMEYAQRKEDAARAPRLLPSVLLVPRAWAGLDEPTRAGALAAWKAGWHIPALERRMREKAKFSSVSLVRFTPVFLKGRPEAGDGIEYLACRSYNGS